MSSYFDALFGAHAAPALMNTMGTPTSVTIIAHETTVVQDADAIIRHVQGIDEITADGTEVKRLLMEIDLAVDDSLSWKGLASEWTNAVVIVEGERWSIDQIGNKTKTFHRLRLIRKVGRAKRRSGFYLDQ